MLLKNTIQHSFSSFSCLVPSCVTLWRSWLWHHLNTFLCKALWIKRYKVVYWEDFSGEDWWYLGAPCSAETVVEMCCMQCHPAGTWCQLHLNKLHYRFKMVSSTKTVHYRWMKCAKAFFRPVQTFCCWFVSSSAWLNKVLFGSAGCSISKWSCLGQSGWIRSFPGSPPGISHCTGPRPQPHPSLTLWLTCASVPAGCRRHGASAAASSSCWCSLCSPQCWSKCPWKRTYSSPSPWRPPGSSTVSGPVRAFSKRPLWWD